MGRILIRIGLLLMVLPFVVMGLEVLYANLTGATGEAAMAAGFWGVMVGFFTFIPGFILLVIGVIVYFLQD